MWESDSYETQFHISEDYSDGGQNEDATILYGAFFFLSGEKTEHRRQVYNIVNLLTDLGGIQASLLMIVGGFAKYINT